MIVDQVVNNVEVGLFYARMVSLLRNPNPQGSIDPFLRQELVNGFQSVYYPPTGLTVGAYYGGDNNRKVLLLDGALTTVQAANLISGYAAYLGLQVINGDNLWFRENMNAYLAMMQGGHLQVPEYLDIVGYSAGGAAATCIAWKLKMLGSLLKLRVFSYGAPRPGGPYIRDRLERTPIARYMTFNDPIPLVPPRIQDAPTLTATVPISVSLSWSNMVHTQGGIVLYEDGSTENALLPPEAIVNPGTSLSAWFFQTAGAENNPHAMSRYVNYLEAANARFDTPREKLREVAPEENVEALQRKEINKQRDRVVTAVALQQRDQANTIVNQPAFVLFKPVRFGRIWAVVLGDKIVAQGVREDTCRHICRAGNDFLRSLPRQGLVDPLSLLEQVEAFLLFATAQESEWVPKLRTNLDLG